MIPEQLLAIALFIGVLLLFYLLGVPVAFSMILTSVVIMVSPFGTGLDLGGIAIQLLNGLNSFILIAVPLYVMLGRLLNRIGLTERIFDFASSVVGQFKGGLVYVNVLASMLFSGMSGLALADVAGLGRIEYRAMKDAGYNTKTSIGITGSSSIIGPIIPPSVTMIIYAILAGVSIGSLFIAGIVPGLILGFSLMIFGRFQVQDDNQDIASTEFEISNIWYEFKRAFLALLIPVIIIVGILSGLFTATEAGAVAVLVTFVLGIYYRELTVKNTFEEFKQGMIETFSILLIVAAASLYGFVAIQIGLPATLVDIVTSLTSSAMVATLLIVVLLLVIGTFMEPLAALTILVPILLPILNSLQIDPLHFGVIMVLSLSLGTITPPLGVILFVLERITGESSEKVIRSIAPYYVPIIVTLLIIVLIPDVALMLPHLFS